MPLATSGRCTLTATSSPVGSTALYTCPRLAAAMGRGEIFAYSRSSGAPSCASMHRKASWSGKVGRSSCSCESSSRYSPGSRSGRVDSAWPTLTKAGPSAVRHSRNMAARALMFVATRCRWKSHPSATPKAPIVSVTSTKRRATSSGRAASSCSAATGSYVGTASAKPRRPSAAAAGGNDAGDGSAAEAADVAVVVAVAAVRVVAAPALAGAVVVVVAAPRQRRRLRRARAAALGARRGARSSATLVGIATAVAGGAAVIVVVAVTVAGIIMQLQARWWRTLCRSPRARSAGR
mmetsp:Transcript_6472/g.24057  ORF Transcript_6472/g.24057 Transcript_6472/m.24057 type:complete len:293 (-) Transcript_6472:118-996(-)